MDRHLQDSPTPQNRTTPAVKVFDYERSLARLGGDPKLFAEIVVLFLEDSPQLLERAQVALANQNLPELERAAHSLKGLSVNFDAAQLASAAYSLEHSAHQGDTERAGDYLEEMARELKNVQRELTQFHNQSLGISDCDRT